MDILRAFPDAGWTAVKITQYGHNICAVSGDDCDCAPADHSFALDEEHECNDRTDSSRFLVAGAARAFWLRTQQEQLAEALPALRAELAGANNVIIESNTLLRFLVPDLYLVVLDPSQPDFKASARQFLDRADAFVLRHPLASPETSWPDVPASLFSCTPSFLQPLWHPLPPGLADLVRARLWPRVRV